MISDTAQQSLDGKAAAQFGGSNIHQLKNFARPVQVWRWPAIGSADTANKMAQPKNSFGDALTLADKPTIAVLPFDNMSGDSDQEFFADGLVEDIITALSHLPEFRVIARNSTFTYKGKPIDIVTAARELRAHYVLEGSVRGAGNRSVPRRSWPS